MIAARTYDADLVCAIMTHPEIFATIAEDGQNAADYRPSMDESKCWLTMRTDELIGLYSFKAVNSITLEIHAQVLPEHRARHSAATGRAALKYIYENYPGYLKVVAAVPFCYKNVRDFTLSNGFLIEGVNRQSYRKGGQVFDQWLLGITRDEIGAFLNE